MKNYDMINTQIIGKKYGKYGTKYTLKYGNFTNFYVFHAHVPYKRGSLKLILEYSKIFEMVLIFFLNPSHILEIF